MPDPLLRDLTVYDTEGTRWAVVQRWLKDIVDTINAGNPETKGRDFATMIFTGSAILNNTFGYFKCSTTTKWTRAQLFCQTPPTGAAIIITFVNDAGTSLGVTATVAAGQDRQETVFGSTLTLSPGDIVRCKITQVGSTTPGGYITVNLM
jgi:hypothetical protein